MEYEIRPDPGPAEREALLAALEQAAGDAARGGASSHQREWRRLGLLEQLSPYEPGSGSSGQSSPFD